MIVYCDAHNYNGLNFTLSQAIFFDFILNKKGDFIFRCNCFVVRLGHIYGIRCIRSDLGAEPSNMKISSSVRVF